MSTVPFKESIVFRPKAVGCWQVTGVEAPKGSKLVYEFPHDHEDEMHDTHTFILCGRWRRFDWDAPDKDNAREFIYLPGNSSHDIGFRYAGRWMHEPLDEDVLAFHVKMLTPRVLRDDMMTTHPRTSPVVAVPGEVTVLEQGHLGIVAGGELFCGEIRVEPGAIIYAKTQAIEFRGDGRLERYY